MQNSTCVYKTFGVSLLNKTLTAMTQREYFIAHAPECPDWFVYVSKRKRPEYPVSSHFNAEDQRLISEWGNDPNYDLPDHLSEYQEAVHDYYMDVYIFEANEKMERLCAWRIAFADETIRQLEEEYL